MWWTRLWLLLLSLAVATLSVLGVALLREFEAESLRHRDALLVKSQTTIEQALRLEAAELLEAATVIASDVTLASTLEDQARGLGEPQLLRSSLKKRLRLLAEGRRLSLLWLLDRDGQVLARVGLDEDRSGDSLVGWPVAELALRGYRLDDLFEHGGRVYTVAAVPLAALAHDRYAGALLIGIPLDENLGEKLGLAAIFRHGDRLLGASSASPPADAKVLEVQRPGSVKGVSILTWQRASSLSPLARTQALLASLPLGWLLRGALLSGLLLAVGWLLLRLDRPAPEPTLPLFASPGPASPLALPDAPSVPATPALPTEEEVDGEPGSLEQLPRLYAEFVAAKARRGESLVGLSYETFCEELKESAARIQNDQGCREVRFRVHETDGRASLRATPVW